MQKREIDARRAVSKNTAGSSFRLMDRYTNSPTTSVYSTASTDASVGVATPPTTPPTTIRGARSAKDARPNVTKNFFKEARSYTG